MDELSARELCDAVGDRIREVLDSDTRMTALRRRMGSLKTMTFTFTLYVAPVADEEGISDATPPEPKLQWTQHDRKFLKSSGIAIDQE